MPTCSSLPAAIITTTRHTDRKSALMAELHLSLTMLQLVIKLAAYTLFKTELSCKLQRRMLSLYAGKSMNAIMEH